MLRRREAEPDRLAGNLVPGFLLLCLSQFSYWVCFGFRFLTTTTTKSVLSPEYFHRAKSTCCLETHAV